METNKLSEKEFSELFLAAYDEISEGPIPSGNDMPAFLETLAFSLALTINEKTGITVNISTIHQQLLIIYTSDEGPDVTQDKEKFSAILFQRLRFLDILSLSQESVSNADREPIFKEIRNRFEAAHAVLNGIGKKADSNPLPERVSIGGSNDASGSFKDTVITISDKLRAHKINLDRELLEAFVSELIGQGHDINNPAKFIPVLIRNLKKAGVIRTDGEGKPILTSVPPVPESQPQLTLDLFKTAHKKTYVPGSVTFIQDLSAELAGLCNLDESAIKYSIMDILVKLGDQHGSQKAQEIFRKEPERFYPLLMEELSSM